MTLFLAKPALRAAVATGLITSSLAVTHPRHADAAVAPRLASVSTAVDTAPIVLAAVRPAVTLVDRADHPAPAHPSDAYLHYLGSDVYDWNAASGWTAPRPARSVVDIA